VDVGVIVKRCTACGEVKPLSEYYQRRHGRNGKCRLCELAVNRQYTKSALGRDRCRAARHRYDQTDKARHKYARYRQTEKRKAVLQRYLESPKGKLFLARFSQLESFKQASKKYAQSPKGKETKIRGGIKRRSILENVIREFTAQDWAELLLDYDHRCAYCHKKDLCLTRDHIVPLSKGGHHTKSNIVPACQSCNSRKHVALWQPVKAS
jgi:5-methylcytosine-specific restriction endonuclease McrA